MKTLFVMRHAKAERDSDSGRDFDRPLAKGGWRDAEAVGREMRSRELRPDLVLASPARRAAETVAAVAEGYGRLEPAYELAIYNAPADRLIEIVRTADDNATRLLIVGHNPGFQDLLGRLVDDEPGEPVDQIVDGFPTAAFAAVQLPAERWCDLSERSGRIVELILPRDLVD
ncbi:MAG TPA: histidine phosphatase family protein [Sphingomicrobium sp.]